MENMCETMKKKYIHAFMIKKNLPEIYIQYLVVTWEFLKCMEKIKRKKYINIIY